MKPLTTKQRIRAYEDCLARIDDAINEGFGVFMCLKLADAVNLDPFQDVFEYFPEFNLCAPRINKDDAWFEMDSGGMFKRALIMELCVQIAKTSKS